MSEAPIAASPLDVGVIHPGSMWMRCFHIVADKNRKEGREVVKFSDVDDVVVAMAKHDPERLASWLMDNAKVSGAGTASAGLPG